MFALLMLLACEKNTVDTCGLESADDWAWTGECPQMTTPCDLECADGVLAIDYAADGGMTMGMPYGGTVEGSTVTFDDGDTILGCVGTIEDLNTITGTCEGGCTFTLSR